MKCCVLAVDGQVQTDLFLDCSIIGSWVTEMERIDFGVNGFENKTILVGCTLSLVRCFSFLLC